MSNNKLLHTFITWLEREEKAFWIKNQHHRTILKFTSLALVHQVQVDRTLFLEKWHKKSRRKTVKPKGKVCSSQCYVSDVTDSGQMQVIKNSTPQKPQKPNHQFLHFFKTKGVYLSTNPMRINIINICKNTIKFWREGNAYVLSNSENSPPNKLRTRF